ncbi:MAG: hypothetical protein ACTFAL_08950 [Candidatus Electronema sp. V4]|uniref:hypothetical protein n=1 Tax=Candidatus Electronema sp. V4 TaxID=3454756 RepID=UPI0040554C08
MAEFQGWLHGDGAAATPEEAQKRFTFLRLRFNAVLTQLDLFGDVITQERKRGLAVRLGCGFGRCVGHAGVLPDAAGDLLP